ncbi:hypothetical protein [Symbiobacterium terraclitae]|uniref:hypothetical protein n=1 Tax=Symbiobacterium terraclitae TaxID=557451 RepID=UPI0035B53056
MSNLQELVWALKGKGFSDATVSRDGRSITFSTWHYRWGWQDLLERFRVVFGPWWTLVRSEERTTISFEGDGDELAKCCCPDYLSTCAEHRALV